MSKQSIDASAHMEGTPQSEQLFSVEREYARCVTALNRTGILTLLPKSESIGVIGIDGKEYPVPTPEQVVELFAHNRELVGKKVPQGFDCLELSPMAMPIPLLIDRMKAAILKHAAEGKIYQTRRSLSDPLIPVRVNTKKPCLAMGYLKTGTRYRQACIFSSRIFQQSSRPDKIRGSQ